MQTRQRRKPYKQITRRCRRKRSKPKLTHRRSKPKLTHRRSESNRSKPKRSKPKRSESKRKKYKHKRWRKTQRGGATQNPLHRNAAEFLKFHGVTGKNKAEAITKLKEKAKKMDKEILELRKEDKLENIERNNDNIELDGETDKDKSKQAADTAAQVAEAAAQVAEAAEAAAKGEQYETVEQEKARVIESKKAAKAVNLAMDFAKANAEVEKVEEEEMATKISTKLFDDDIDELINKFTEIQTKLKDKDSNKIIEMFESESQEEIQRILIYLAWKERNIFSQIYKEHNKIFPRLHCPFPESNKDLPPLIPCYPYLTTYSMNNLTDIKSDALYKFHKVLDNKIAEKGTGTETNSAEAILEGANDISNKLFKHDIGKLINKFKEIQIKLENKDSTQIIKMFESESQYEIQCILIYLAWKNPAIFESMRTDYSEKLQLHCTRPESEKGISLIHGYLYLTADSVGKLGNIKDGDLYKFHKVLDDIITQS